MVLSINLNFILASSCFSRITASSIAGTNRTTITWQLSAWTNRKFPSLTSGVKCVHRMDASVRAFMHVLSALRCMLCLFVFDLPALHTYVDICKMMEEVFVCPPFAKHDYYRDTGLVKM